MLTKSPKVLRGLVYTGGEGISGWREGKYFRVVGCMIHVTDAAIAGGVRLKKQRNVDKKHCVVVWWRLITEKDFFF